MSPQATRGSLEGSRHDLRVASRRHLAAHEGAPTLALRGETSLNQACIANYLKRGNQSDVLAFDFVEKHLQCIMREYLRVYLYIWCSCALPD